MKVIKKIDVWSLAKIAGVLFGGVYLVIGLAINLAVLIFGIPALKTFDLLGFGSGVLATLLVALLVGSLSFVFGALFGWLYNIAAKIVGGIAWMENEREDPLFTQEELVAKIPSAEHLPPKAKEPAENSAPEAPESEQIPPKDPFVKDDAYSSDGPNFLAR